MSWVSTGRRPCGTMSPHLPGYLAAHGYETAGFVANLDYCSRETGLARGFAHYEDFPSTSSMPSTAYIALGHRIDISSWALRSGQRSWRELTGHWYDLIPRSKEHAEERRGGRPVRFCGGWQGGRESRRPFFAFSELTTTPTALMRLPDRSTAGLWSPARVIAGPPDA